MHTRTLTLIATSLIALVIAAVAANPATAATALRPRTALLYRINQVRADHHLAPVHPSSSLQRAASHHSDDMLVRDYFAHTSPNGSTVYTRIVNTGFVSGYSWLGGETLAWGTGTLATPLATVNAWLASPEHRAIMLSPVPLGRDQPHLRPLRGPRRCLCLDRRLGQALVDIPTPAAAPAAAAEYRGREHPRRRYARLPA